MEFSRQEYWSGVAISFSRGSSPPWDHTQVFCIAGRFFIIWATWEAIKHRLILQRPRSNLSFRETHSSRLLQLCVSPSCPNLAPWSCECSCPTTLTWDLYGSRPYTSGVRVVGGIGGTSGQCNDAAGPKGSRALSVVQTWAHISRLVNKRVHTHTHTHTHTHIYRHTHTHPLLSASPKPSSLSRRLVHYSQCPPEGRRGLIWGYLHLQYIYRFCFVLYFPLGDGHSGRMALSFPSGASGKEHTCHCRRHKRQRLDPWVWSERSPGEGNGNPLQYSCLGNPMDRGAWRSTVHRDAKSWTWLKLLSTHAFWSVWGDASL